MPIGCRNNQACKLYRHNSLLSFGSPVACFTHLVDICEDRPDPRLHLITDDRCMNNQGCCKLYRHNSLTHLVHILCEDRIDPRLQHLITGDRCMNNQACKLYRHNSLLLSFGFSLEKYLGLFSCGIIFLTHLGTHTYARIALIHGCILFTGDPRLHLSYR
jgi:hypothetical protein